LLLETDPTVSGQAPPTWVCTPRTSFLARRRSDRSPLHDVRQHDSIGSATGWSRSTFLNGREKIPAGGARRDRTDDLLLAKQALSQLSYGPAGGPRTDDRSQQDIRRPSSVFRRLIMVGLGRFELPTSRLSSARSNQLSYKPAPEDRGRRTEDRLHFTCRPSSDVCRLIPARPRRKRNVDGGVPPESDDRRRTTDDRRHPESAPRSDNVF
jgi:hypothetical protein